MKNAKIHKTEWIGVKIISTLVITTKNVAENNWKSEDKNTHELTTLNNVTNEKLNIFSQKFHSLERN